MSRTCASGIGFGASAAERKCASALATPKCIILYLFHSRNYRFANNLLSLHRLNLLIVREVCATAPVCPPRPSHSDSNVNKFPIHLMLCSLLYSRFRRFVPRWFIVSRNIYFAYAIINGKRLRRKLMLVSPIQSKLNFIITPLFDVQTHIVLPPTFSIQTRSPHRIRRMVLGFRSMKKHFKLNVLWTVYVQSFSSIGNVTWYILCLRFEHFVEANQAPAFCTIVKIVLEV